MPKSNLESQIEKIGRELVVDDYKDCDDIKCSRKEGIVPRCLVYENGGRAHSTGVVIIGMNPGPAEEDEKRAMSGVPTYEKYLKYFYKNVRVRSYYVNLNKLVHILGLHGPIVWTEFVKCQSKVRGKLSVPTIRRDIHKYLLREIKCVPREWPLIGVGYEQYKILSYIFPNRIVIGVPHVKSFGGYFYKLVRPNHPKKINTARRELQTALEKNDPILISLFDKT